MYRIGWVLILTAGSLSCGERVIFERTGSTGSGGAATSAVSSSAGSTTAMTSTTLASSSSATSTQTSSSGQNTKIDCVGTTCDETTEKCCIPVPVNGPTGCIPQGGTCPGYVAECSTAANCPAGQVCCVELLMPNITAECVSSCSPGPQICETDAECLTGKCSTGSGIGIDALKSCK